MLVADAGKRANLVSLSQHYQEDSDDDTQTATETKSDKPPPSQNKAPAIPAKKPNTGSFPPKEGGDTGSGMSQLDYVCSYVTS